MPIVQETFVPTTTSVRKFAPCKCEYGVPCSFASGSIYAYAQNKVRLAQKIRENMPLSVIGVVQSHTWHGGPLINLKDNSTRPTAEELCLNSMWLLPIVKECPDKARFQCLIFKARLKLRLNALPTKTMKGVETTTVCHWFFYVGLISFMCFFMASVKASKKRQGPHLDVLQGHPCQSEEPSSSVESLSPAKSSLFSMGV